MFAPILSILFILSKLFLSGASAAVMRDFQEFHLDSSIKHPSFPRSACPSRPFRVQHAGHNSRRLCRGRNAEALRRGELKTV